MSNEDAAEAIEKARLTVWSLQLGRGQCEQDGDIPKYVDLDGLPCAERELQVFEVRRECSKHWTDRCSAGSDLSITRSDEDNVFGAQIQYRVDIPPRKRRIERDQRIPHGLRVAIHAKTVRRCCGLCNRSDSAGERAHA